MKQSETILLPQFLRQVESYGLNSTLSLFVGTLMMIIGAIVWYQLEMGG